MMGDNLGSWSENKYVCQGIISINSTRMKEFFS